LDKAAEREIEEAVQYAESSPEPSPETLYQHIYVEAV
jgi:TPP-dependent pyruvate/acetoin dehydrogenase alpha subunit